MLELEISVDNKSFEVFSGDQESFEIVSISQESFEIVRSPSSLSVDSVGSDSSRVSDQDSVSST
eukprot:15195329-Ditylum_brightwellii.AAC.1